MQGQIENLGKVAVTVDKNYWSRNKDYDKLTIVEAQELKGTFISRKPVPAGIELTDRNYWIKLVSNDSIRNIIKNQTGDGIIIDNDNEIKFDGIINKIPTDVYRIANKVAFVYNNQDNILFWLEAANTTSAGLMSSNDFLKLGDLPTNEELLDLLHDKQNVLQAGRWIHIEEDEISVFGLVDETEFNDIVQLIPNQATTSNQLADKQFVNSSIATSTATFRGSYNLISALYLNVDATHAEIEAALGTRVSNADNNDYVFVFIPTSSSTPTQIAATERYKFNGTSWSFEYTLNNSGFTAEQWEAINSGITDIITDKVLDLPTNDELVARFAEKQNKIPLATSSGRTDNLKMTLGNSQITSSGGVSLGFEHVVSGNNAAAIGSRNSNEAEASLTTGYYNHNYQDAKCGATIGEYLKINNRGEVAICRYNNSESNQLFSIGIGTANNLRKNAFAVKNDGKIYIYGIGGYLGYINDINIATDLATVVTNIYTKLTNKKHYKYAKIVDGYIPCFKCGNIDSLDLYTHDTELAISNATETPVSKFVYDHVDGKCLAITLRTEIHNVADELIQIDAPTGYKIKTVRLALKTNPNAVYQFTIFGDVSGSSPEFIGTDNHPWYAVVNEETYNFHIGILNNSNTTPTANDEVIFTYFEVELESV